MKRTVLIVVLLVLAAAAGAVLASWPALRGIIPALVSPRVNVADYIPSAAPADVQMPCVASDLLSVPDGFCVEVLARDLPGARVLAMDADGDLWVSSLSGGTVKELDMENGVVVAQRVVFTGKKPHGIAFDPSDANMLYIAEEARLIRIDVRDPSNVTQIATFPSGALHITRTIAFGPDDRLYASIGSSCNVCHETDDQHATIWSMNKDGSDARQFARGLRNSVFFDWSEVDGRMWATEMGRDNLGNVLPPDEINVIVENRNYGWPTCYGQNIHDDNFDHNASIRNPCVAPFVTPSAIDLPAHVAPLGLAFVPEEGWPEEYWYNLFVAEHGSWNSTVPVGYKIVRLKLDAAGTYTGSEDFLTGFLVNGGAIGRPVDIMTVPGGTMYVTDDKAGVVYRVRYVNETP